MKHEEAYKRLNTEGKLSTEQNWSKRVYGGRSIKEKRKMEDQTLMEKA